MAIKILAFDIHETLTRWPAGRVRPIEVQHLLRDFGVDISYQAYEVARAAVFVMDGPKRRIEDWTDFLALLFARMDVRVSIDLLTSLTAMFEARDGMEFFPDALDAIAAAKGAGLVTCSYTTLPRFMLGPKVGKLLTLLDHYYNCSDIGLPKGHRRFYDRITENLGVDPGEILCVGDDPIGDCRLPVEAGWHAVLLDRTGRHGDGQFGQIATIASLAELNRHFA